MFTPKAHFKVYMARAFPGNRSRDSVSEIGYRVGVGPQVGLRQVASFGHVTTPGRSQTGPARSRPYDRSKTKQAFGCRGPARSGSNAPTGKSKTVSGDPRTRRPSFARCRHQEVGCWGPRRTTAPARAAHSPTWTHRSSSREGDDRTCKLSQGWVGWRDWPDWRATSMWTNEAKVNTA